MPLSVGVADPATPVAGVTTVKLTVPVVAVCVPTLSLVSTLLAVVVATAPCVTVKVSLSAFIFTKVIVRVSVVILPKRSFATKLTVRVPLGTLQKSAGAL